MSSVFTVEPLRGQKIERNWILAVDDLLPESVNCILLRFAGQSFYIACVHGDGAIALRRENARWLRVTEVGELSGCGKAVVDWCKC